MITIQQIDAESILPALTATEQLALEMLIKAFKGYRMNIGLYPALSDAIDAEQAVPTVKSQALKAVLRAAGLLPPIVVESQGQDTAPSFFSTKVNWDELAQDALNVLYDLNVSAGGGAYNSNFILIRKHLEDIAIPCERGILIKRTIT